MNIAANLTKELNNLPTTDIIEVSDGSVKGKFGQSSYEQNINDFELKIGYDEKNNRFLTFEALYVPHVMRNKNVGQNFVHIVENFCKQNAFNYIKVTPGDEKGGLFWTFQKYYWKEPSQMFCSDIIKIANFIKEPELLNDLKGRDAYRFRKIKDQTKQLQKCYSSIDHYAFLSQKILDGYSPTLHWFHILDIYDLGLGSKFICKHDRKRTHPGKLILENSGRWSAYKYFWVEQK